MKNEIKVLYFNPEERRAKIAVKTKGNLVNYEVILSGDNKIEKIGIDNDIMLESQEVDESLLKLLKQALNPYLMH